MDYKQKAAELVAQMTLEEKVGLCSGKDFWCLKSVERLGLPSVMVTDGPHGLRKQAGASDHLGLNASVPATCFPTESTTACSFDRELLHELGVAMAEECLQEDVAVILGPGVNIKRSPLCGRNFEYVSEDPYVAGELGSAVVDGIQSKGVGTSLKHFAGNNQETRRLAIDSVIDERALREIYLPAFETVVKRSQPWTIMNAYNSLNGEFCSQNDWLLNKVLRDEWGFEGLVVTDWGAAVDRVKGVAAGVDLEMPHFSDDNDRKLKAAVEKGELDVAVIDRAAARVTELILKALDAKKEQYDIDAHHEVAKKAAARSCVLLKNDGGLLPLGEDKSFAVIGAFAKTPRYQGAGSSQINCHKIDCAFDAFTALGREFAYADGYDISTGTPDEARIAEAVEAARGKDVVLIFAGLTDEYESEGYDRKTMAMPEAHNKLIEAVAEVNPNVVVILSTGSVIELPWEDKAAAILLGGLGGQAGGSAVVQVITGEVCASGKLAETWPLKLEDNPSHGWFPGNIRTVEYRESIYVGYRYYDTAKKNVRYPFGYGLSYTTYEYSGIKLSAEKMTDADTLEVSFTVKNTGAVAGTEIAQIYVAAKDSTLPRAEQELREFVLCRLEPGEEREYSVKLSKRAFAYYNTNAADWCVESGKYEIRVSASSRDIRLTGEVEIEAQETVAPPDYHAIAPALYDITERVALPDDQFAALLGRPIPPSDYAPGEPFTVCSTLEEIGRTKRGQQAKEIMLGGMVGPKASEAERMMVESMIKEMPVRSLGMFGGMDEALMLDLLKSLNKPSYGRGIRRFKRFIKMRNKMMAKMAKNAQK